LSARGSDLLRLACLTGLGSGYSPLASGTAGSLAATAVYAVGWFLAVASGASRPLIDVVTLIAVIAAFALAIRWGDWAVTHFASNDPKPFTLDEFVGQWLALLFLPLGVQATPREVAVLLAGQFLAFRLFDILKPPPARRAERLPGGWGITLDDVFAGVYANLLGQVIWRLTPAAAWIGPPG
jgi:phosphatidylglycerophosphatase A